MIRRVLLDTNVILDYCLGRAKVSVCTDLISELVKRDIEIFVAPSSLKDVFFIVEREMKRGARADGREGLLSHEQADAARRIAWACLEQVLAWATVANQGQSEYTLAHMLQSIHSDFEDNLILAAAETSNVDLVVSSDEALIRHASTVCLLPEDALNYIRGRCNG